MDEEISEEAMLEKEDIVEEVNIEEEDTIEEEAKLTESQSSEIVEPKLGMMFPDVDAVYNFWKTYGTEKGFPVRKRSSKKRNGKLVYLNYMCSFGGKSESESSNSSRLQTHTRLGCPVKMTAGLGIDGQWCVTVLNICHNHALSPTKSRYFRCNRFISENVKQRLELNDRAGIRVHKNIKACVEEIGGFENATFTAKDARNHIYKARDLQMTPLATHYEMEKQFKAVYTLSKFKEFQKELLSKLYCDLVSKNEDGLSSEWVIEEDIIVGEGIPKRVNFAVSMNQDDVRCSCQLFELKGILCRHAMYAFIRAYGNVKLPEKYIFKSWRKDARKRHLRSKNQI